MGQGLSRKRSGTATITADKSDTPCANSNGDVVKTEANGSAVQAVQPIQPVQSVQSVQASDTANSEQDAQADGAPGKKEKKKRRFIFSLKRSRPGSGKKKKAKKEKSSSYDTSTNSGKSNRSSLFMDEFQIPEDDGIDSVSLSSNEDKENKKRKDSGGVIRRSKRGSKSSKNGKKGKKKKQKTEKKKEEKSKKKNSKEEDKAVEAADASLNVNQSVEPLHASVEAAKDEAKAAAVGEPLLESEIKTTTETKEDNSAKSEPEKAAEDDLVAAVTAVMDSQANEDKSGEETVKVNEDDEVKTEMVVECPVKEEVILSVDATLQEAAVTPEHQATSESTPSPISNDSPDSPDSPKEAVSPTLSVDESGTPKRVSLGPRLKTAILKKYSGAGDAAAESQRVTLTKPKIVDVPDLVPPPRKNRARRLLSQKASNASSGDPNTSTTNSIEPSSPSNVSNSGLDTSASSATESSSRNTEDTNLAVNSPTDTESVQAKVEDVKDSQVPSSTCPDTKVYGRVNASTGPSEVADIDEHVEAIVNANSGTELLETDVKYESESNQSSTNVGESLSNDFAADTCTVGTEAVQTGHGIESLEKASDSEPETHNVAKASDNVPEDKSVENISGSVPDVDDPGNMRSGLSLAQQAKMVVEQVMGGTTNSLSESVLNEGTSENVSQPTPGPLDSDKTSDKNFEEHVLSTERIVLNEESMIRVETNKDNDECILKEVEIIVAATKTYDSDPETDDYGEKSEPVVIIERVHVEPYFGPEFDKEGENNGTSDPKGSTSDNTTVTFTTSSETVVKRQKYSKETGEVCKECLCEEETTKVTRVTNIEHTVSNVNCELNESNTVVKDTVESDSSQPEPPSENQGEQKDVVDSPKEDHDDSSSSTTDSTVVDEEDQEKTLVDETDSVANTQEETAAEDKPSGSPEDAEKDDEKRIAQERELEVSACVHTETAKEVGDECNDVVVTATTCGDKVSPESEKCETVDVKLNGDKDTSSLINEIDISDNNNCKDIHSPAQETSVQVTDNSTEDGNLVRTDKPPSTATEQSAAVQ